MFGYCLFLHLRFLGHRRSAEMGEAEHRTFRRRQKFHHRLWSKCWRHRDRNDVRFARHPGPLQEDHHAKRGTHEFGRRRRQKFRDQPESGRCSRLCRREEFSEAKYEEGSRMFER